MIEDIVVTQFAYMIANRFEAINSKYLQLMGTHLKEMGSLTATDIHRQKQMIKMGANVEQIRQELAATAGMSSAEIDAMYDKILESEYADAEVFYQARHQVQPPLSSNMRLLFYTQSIKNLTANTFQNISHTTNIDSTYRNLVDTAIMAITQGTTDFQSSIRSALMNAAVGMRVEYASGRTRRLDSAIRMNVMEGFRQLNQGLRKLEGDQFGADGYEISAHALCATDHIPIQGKQYSKIKYEKLNDSLDRPIGTLNCGHVAFPIILGINKPTYSDEELQELAAMSNKKTEIFGQEKTKYEWSQVQRKLETEMRYAKDQAIIARAAGDTELEKKANAKVKSLTTKYNTICAETGLDRQISRAYVPGYRGSQVKPKSVVQQTIKTDRASILQKELTEKLESNSFSGLSNWISQNKEELKQYGFNVAEDVYTQGYELMTDYMDKGIVPQLKSSTNNTKQGSLSSEVKQKIMTEQLQEKIKEQGASYYADQLAYIAPSNKPVDVLEKGNNTAWAYVEDQGDNLYIYAIASSGGGLGTELLIDEMEKAVSLDKGISWTADQDESISYYTHIGLQGNKNPEYVSYSYTKEELIDIIKKLKRRG